MLTLWQQRFGVNIYEAIGMSECSYYLSQHISRPIRPGSAGFPQPGHHIALLDKNMQPVEDEQEGMLCIGLDLSSILRNSEP
jgi:acetyl-CoA synthetase